MNNEIKTIDRLLCKTQKVRAAQINVSNTHTYIQGFSEGGWLCFEDSCITIPPRFSDDIYL